MKSILLAIIIMTSQLTYADCNYGDELDLRKVHPKIFQRLHIKDQKKDSLCFSYSGTMLTDFHRFMNGAKSYSTISPLEAAMYSRINYEDYDTRGGQVCQVVNSLKKRGYGCAADKLDMMDPGDKKIKEFAKFVQIEIVSVVFSPYILTQETYQPMSKKDFAQSEKHTPLQKRHMKRFKLSHEKIKREYHSKKFEDDILPSFEDLFFLSQDIHLNKRYVTFQSEFADLMLARYCNTHLEVPKTITCNSKYNSDEYLSEIQESLNAKRPIGITFCSNVLTDKKFNGRNDSDLCKYHASIIIGKKFDSTQGCSYLIRNSWGKYKKYPWETSEGDIWLGEKTLKNNIFGIHLVN